MDLFRRIFGKTGEDLPKEDDKQVETPVKTEPVSDASSDDAQEELDPLDPTTYPVSALPPEESAKVKQMNKSPDGVTQPLPPESALDGKQEYLAFGQTSDVGLVRSNNQDAALSFFFKSDSADNQPSMGLFIVADGMGGHHDGERASAIATRIIAQNIMKTIYMPILVGELASERPPITEALVSAVQKANFEVIRHVPEGGTTTTAAIVIGDLAYIVHVGDSRAYLMTEDGLEQITRDHSLVQRLIELDQLTREEAEQHPQKNVLYRALGQNETLEVDAVTRRLPANARLLICSDGLWGQLEDKEIFEISMNNPDPQLACDKLVALANTNGGLDNITAVLLKIN